MWPFKRKRNSKTPLTADRLLEFELAVLKRVDRDSLENQRTIEIVRSMQRETLLLAADVYTFWFRLDELRKRLTT